MPKQALERIIDSRSGAATVLGGVGGGSSLVLSHSALLGLTTDDHPQYLRTDGTRTLTGNLSIDSGITVDGIDISAHAANPDAHHATATAGDGIGVSGQQISLASSVAGAGLAYASGVLSVGAGYGLAVNANDVQLAASAAGAGLTYTLGVLAVGAGLGMTVNADDVALTTPGTLTVATTNASTGNHTHAITSSSAPGATASLLASSALGALTLPLLTATTSLTTPLIAADVSLSIAPAVDINLSPVGDVVLGDGLTFRTNSFSTSYPIEGAILAETAVSGQYGLTVGVISVDELRTRVFVADEVRIDRGEEVWSKSYGIVAEDFTTPSSIGGTVVVTFESSPMVSGALFSTNDWLLFRTIDIDSGVVLSSVWGQVSGYTATNIQPFWNDLFPDDGWPDSSFPNIDLGTTTQDWTFTLRSGDTNYRIPNGQLGIDYGASGQSYIAFSVTDPIAAPFIRIRRWAGANPYTPANHDDTVYIGNLTGIAGGTGDRGIWTQSSDGTAWAELSDSGVILRNSGIDLYSGATRKVHIGSDGTDFWMGVSSADKRLSWDGSTLSVVGAITITSGSGYSVLTDTPTTIATINQAEAHNLTTSAANVFMETWDDPNALARWTNYTGSGELSIASISDGVAGGKALLVGNNSGNDMAWLICTHKLPYDATKTYRIRVRIKRTTGTGTVYVGFAGVASDGSTFVNTAGTNAYDSQHYHAASGSSPSTTWTEYVGYTRGFGTPTGTGGVGTALTPGAMHSSVRYVRPLIVVNYSGVAGQTYVDMISVEAISAAWYNIDSLPTRFGETPTTSGLYLTATHLGYYNGSAWKAWIASTGQFYFGGSSGAHLEWDGTYLKGVNASSATEWQASSADGLIYAGATVIGSHGIRFDNDLSPGVYDVAWENNGVSEGYIRGSYDLDDWLGLELYSSGYIFVTGNVDIVSGYLTTTDLRASKLTLDAVSTPSTPASGGVLYIDTSDGDLKVKFANGTVRTIEVN